MADVLSGVAVGHATTHVGSGYHAWAVHTAMFTNVHHTVQACASIHAYKVWWYTHCVLCVGCVSMHACMHHMAVWWQCGGVARLHACMVDSQQQQSGLLSATYSLTHTFGVCTHTHTTGRHMHALPPPPPHHTTQGKHTHTHTKGHTEKGEHRDCQVLLAIVMCC